MNCLMADGRHGKVTAEQIKAWRIRHFGEHRGATKDCSEYLGVSRWAVWMYEAGTRSPRAATVNRMLALDRDPEAREVQAALERFRQAKGGGR